MAGRLVQLIPEKLTDYQWHAFLHPWARPSKTHLVRVLQDCRHGGVIVRTIGLIHGERSIGLPPGTYLELPGQAPPESTPVPSPTTHHQAPITPMPARARWRELV